MRGPRQSRELVDRFCQAADGPGEKRQEYSIGGNFCGIEQSMQGGKAGPLFRPARRHHIFIDWKY